MHFSDLTLAVDATKKQYCLPYGSKGGRKKDERLSVRRIDGEEAGSEPSTQEPLLCHKHHRWWALDPSARFSSLLFSISLTITTVASINEEELRDLLHNREMSKLINGAASLNFSRCRRFLATAAREVDVGSHHAPLASAGSQAPQPRKNPAITPETQDLTPGDLTGRARGKV
jgi:hypothetical protein